MKNSGEFIGTNIKIIRANNKTLIGLEGRVIDETKNTFTILTTQKKRNEHDKQKIVLKKGAVFMINNQLINGEQITKKPEERIKLKQ
jgi:ribonuclease P protein subunit POP4